MVTSEIDVSKQPEFGDIYTLRLFGTNMTQSDKQSIFTESEMKEIENVITLQISRIAWRFLAWIGIPMVGLIFGYGALYLQTQKNTLAIETSVLTVKDKDNLDLKIENLSQKIDTNNTILVAAIGELKTELRANKQ